MTHPAEDGPETTVSGSPAEGDDAAPQSEIDPEDDLSLEVEVEGEALSEEDKLRAKIEELEAAKKETYERLLRTTADLDNYRKRARRDLADARVEEHSKVLKEILPIVDNIERALAHAQSIEGANASIVEGIKLVMRQTEQTLERIGVKVIDAVGKPFDPALHEAVSQAPSDEHPPGTVIAAVQTGYQIGERLLRPTLSVVSIALPAAAPEDEEKGEE
jgi:molecular chaperone GrpE